MMFKNMRTTLTIDNDVAHNLKTIAMRQQKSFKEVVNQALRRGLAQTGGAALEEAIKLKTRSLRYRKGVDEVRIKDHLDEFDSEDQDNFSNR
jgi:rhamnose utilization protein RhaD (predicted bifunctional aldolase and dehydrogenase)